MKKIFSFFTEKHLLATLITFAILIAGIMSTIEINKDLFPRVKLNRVSITTVYPGAAADDIELNVTAKIETALKSVDGIDKMTSVSAEDYSIISIRIDENYKNQEVIQALQDIRSAVSRISDLPEGMEGKPVVARINDSQLPVIGMGITSDLSYQELRDYSRHLEKKVLELPGVARIYKTGFRKREIKIEADSEKLYEYEMPVTELAEAVQRRNIHLSSGTVESYTTETDIVTISKFTDPLDVGEVIVRKAYGAKPTLLKSIAKISDSYKDEKICARLNGQNVIYFDIEKKEDADIIKTVNSIKKIIEEEKESQADKIDINYSNDLSRYVRASFNVVMSNGVMGFFLVVLVLSLFLSIRVSIWVALGIPVSLLGAIAILPVFGVTLDVITLAAMILIIGIIVDDAIVISESIFQRFEKGESPFEAAVNGINDVFWPVVTTVVSTLLAFFPMFLIPGDDGKYIFVIPLVICLSLLISMAEGVLCLPAHIAHDLKKVKINYEGKGNIFKRMLDNGSKAYGTLLNVILKFRHLVITGFVVLFFLVMGFATTMVVDLFPTEGAEEFVVYIQTPAGTKLDVTSERMKDVEKIISSLPDKELMAMTTFVGNQEGTLTSGNIGVIRVNLTPYSKRKRNADEISADIQAQCQKLDGFESIYFDVAESGPDPQKPVSLYLTGSHEGFRKKLADDVYMYLKKNEAITSIKRDTKKGKRTLELAINYASLADLGLNVADVAHVLRISFDGEVVTKGQYDSEEVDFRMSILGLTQKAEDKLLDLTVPNKSGRLIRIGEFASFTETEGAAEIYHYNRERSTNIQADINADIASAQGISQEVIERFSDYNLYPGTTIHVEGKAKQTGQSIGHLKNAFILAVIGIYFLLVLLFDSYTQPLLVLAAIPFGMIGVVLVFALHHEPISFMGALGVIGLSGVVVNDSLVLVDNLNKKVKNIDLNNLDELRKVVVVGSRERFRAILMTTITTAAGLIPLAYGIGGSDPSSAPMALSLGWGIVFATPLTLFLVPCLFCAGKDFGRFGSKIRRFLTALLFWKPVK